MTIEMDLVRKLAWSFHRTTGIDFEDLVQEACLTWHAYVEDNPKYDPRRMALTSYAYLCIRSGFLTMASKRQHFVGLPEDFELSNDNPSPEDREIFIDGLRSLSKEANLIVKMIFEAPDEFLGIGSRRETESEIIHRLQSEHDISASTAKEAVNQIKGFLKTGEEMHKMRRTK